MPVAEIFISAFVTILIEKLTSSVLSKLARHEGIQTQLKKWSITFKTIQAVLSDAEEKQITDEAVQMWLDDLQDLAYDLDDILDDLLTEALCRESAMAPQEASTSKLSCLIPTCCTSLTSPSAFLFDYNIRSKLEEINKRLQDLLNRKKDLGLIANVGGIKSYGAGERETTSLVNESHVYGRKNDKEEVLKLLFRDETCNGEVCVIPIVGMGGVGKTTLAQLVYNDDKVKGGFDLKIWVCVSEEFDLFTITTQILGAMALNLNEAQEKLKEKLINKKFLVVLDDVWNEEYGKWDQLYTPFEVGAPGSVVIVTTRNEKVASVMGNVPIYHLNELLDDDCLSILARHALKTRDFEGHPSFKIVAEKLVRKCKGLPLAAKAIGGLLRTKGTPNEWEDILNSKIWELPEESTGILPALRLSYHHLPPRLKRLFAYCSIFPKDYEFDKYELVLLWMAEGFLQHSDGKKIMEEIGFLYFNELVSRSFFQPLSDGEESLFVMHDLMNELAQFVAKGICFRLEDHKMKCTGQHADSEKARHSSFIRYEYGVFSQFEDYYRVHGLRTFLPLSLHRPTLQERFYLSSRVLNDLLPKLRCLRVLSLSGYFIAELSNSIGELKHLRYLNLSHTLIKNLPESVTDLYNLQTLLLCSCRRLHKLPAKIENLINLRHLDIGDTEELLEMPPGIGTLTSLQTLSKIILDKNNTLTVNELRALSDLRGMLAIIGLDNVMNVQEAREANLLCKQGLRELTLTWSSEFDDSRRSESLEYEVLDVLKPHTKLAKLKIVFYGGMRLPSWVCDPSFAGITHLTLKGCKRFASLPSLGHLPSLKELFIEGMSGVKNVGDELYGVGCPLLVAFQSLETLKFENMVGWEEWSFNLTDIDDHVSAFPRLHNLTICDCPVLVKISLPSLPSLRVLNIRRCDEVVLKGIVSVASLTTIEMEGILRLFKLHEGVVRSLGELHHLKIKNCDEMRYLWEEEESSCHNLVNLVDLSVRGCLKLEKLPDLENCLTSLKNLDIEDCPSFHSFQTTTTLPTKEKELIKSNSNNHVENSSHLERLSIIICESLTCFPFGQNLPTTLQYLSLISCNNLEPDSENFWLLNSSISSLKRIMIIDWVKLTYLPRCLFKFFHLTHLTLTRCPGLESFPGTGFPHNLRVLEISECKNLKSLPDDQMQSLTSLVTLRIEDCPCLESFPRGRWPPHLIRLSIGNTKQPISEWGLHRVPSSLVIFFIRGEFPGMMSFLDVGSQLPTSLTSLGIWDLVSIESLSMGLQNLTSLQTLQIVRCPKLQFLPDKLLPTLSGLEIWKCPLLKERCLKEKRDYWPTISHIPCVMIDGVLIQ